MLRNRYNPLYPTSVHLGFNSTEFFMETRNASPAHFLFKIKDFSLLWKNGISEVESVEFKAGDYKWKLIIYPDGDDEAKEADHISVYLCVAGATSQSESWEFNAMCNLFLYNHISDDYLCFRGKTRRFHAINSKLGISKFMAKKCFTDPSNGYLLNDKCVFGAEVFVIKNKRVIEEVSGLVLTNTCKRKWEISDFSKQNVWSSEEFVAGGIKWKINVYPNGISDAKGRYISVFLECVDYKSFAAHKKVNVTCLFIFRKRLPGQKDHSKEVSHWFTSSSGSDWGFANFMEIGEVSKGFIVNDSCHLGIQLYVEGIQEAT